MKKANDILIKSRIFVLIISVLFVCNITRLNALDKKPISIYNTAWIDFNKNNRKDIYEDPAQPIEKRVENLLQQMTIDEKTGQLLTTLGWKMYERDGSNVIITENLKTQILNDHIGSLWGFMREIGRAHV